MPPKNLILFVIFYLKKPIFAQNAGCSIAVPIYRERGKSGQHRASRFLTERGSGMKT